MNRPLFVGSICRSCGWLSANEKEEKNASNDTAMYQRLKNLNSVQLNITLRLLRSFLIPFPGNGKVEFSEFEDMMASQIGEPITTDDMRYYFKKFDANGDGFITSDELALVMKTFGGKIYSKKEIDDMIKEADVDADGKVNYQGTTVTPMRLGLNLESTSLLGPFF